MKAIKMVKRILVLTALSTLLFSCITEEEAAARQNPGSTSVVDLNLSSFNVASAESQVLEFIIPSAHAAVSDLRFCFKRLRFKRADEDTLDELGSEDNVDFEIGEFIIDENGTLLGDVEIPTGDYKRIEFDLEDNCGSGNSVELMNDYGSFTSSDRITVKFKGNFTASQANESVSLGVQSILEAMNDFNGSTSLKDALEAASGNY